MGPVTNIKVTLRFRGDALDPHELTSRLGSAPTAAAAKGETCSPHLARKGSPAGWWRLRIEGDDTESLDARINRLFTTLSPDCATWRDLSARYGGNLFVGVFLGSANEGLTIAPETALAIGERGLSLQLDIYECEAD